MATENWVNIGSGNGLLPNGTKPLPEPMLDLSSVSSSDILLRAINITAGISATNHRNWLQKYSSKISLNSPRPQWVKCNWWVCILSAIVLHECRAWHIPLPVTSKTLSWTSGLKQNLLLNSFNLFASFFQSGKQKLLDTLSLGTASGISHYT